MKYQIILFLITLQFFSIELFSQQLNRNWFIDNYSAVNQIVFDEERNAVYLLTGGVDGTLLIEKRGVDGTLIWLYEVDDLEYDIQSYTAGVIQLLSDGKIAFKATVFECDITKDSKFLVLNEDGVLLFESELDGRANRFLEYPDNIWIISFNRIWEFSKNDFSLKEIEKRNFDPGYGNEFSWSDTNGGFYIGSRNEVITFNENGENIGSYEIEGDPVKGFTFLDNFHLLLFRNKIEIVDKTSGKSLFQFLSESDKYFLDFEVINNEIVLLESGKEIPSTIYRLDNELKLIEEHNFGNEFHRMRDIERFGNNLLVGGAEISIVSGDIFYQNAFLRELNFSDDETFKFSKDAALVDFEIDSLNTEIFKNYSLSTLYNVKIKVRNNGISKIEKLRWNHEIGPPTRCGAEMESKIIETNLEPGEEKFISLGDVCNVSSFHRNGHEDVEQCIWLSTPDEQLDGNNQNDYLCKIFEPNPVSEAELAAAELNIYPNPATESLFIESNLPIGNSKLRIYNALGALVSEFDLYDFKLKLEIPLASHPKGIFYLVFENESGIKNIGWFIIK